MSDAPTQRIDDLRTRFTAICVAMVPERLRAERQEHAPAEFDHLIGDSRCTHVDVVGTSLFIGTAPLLFECRGEHRYVGDFAIRVDAKTRNITCMGSCVRASPNGSGAWHPHVLKTGEVCFGPAGKQRLANWFGDGKLALIGLYVIEFLCIARGESDFTPARAWRKADEEEIIRWKARHPEANGSSRPASSTQPLSTSSASALAAPRRRWFSRS